MKPGRFAAVADGVCGREQLGGDRTFMHLISAPRNLLISFTSGQSAKILTSAPLESRSSATF